MLFKAIRYKTYQAIKKNEEVDYKAVPVFYGYDNYQDSPSHVNKIVRAIQTDFPEMPLDDMHIWKVSQEASNRHASMTTVQISVSVETVKQNLHEYTIL